MAKELPPQEMHIDIDKRLFNPVYYPLLNQIHKYEIYYGGAGSGKSFFIAQKKALQLTTMPGRNMICLRKQKTDCVDSCFGELFNAIKALGLAKYWKIRESPDHCMINIMNQNEIRFDGVDNIENIKSVKFKSGNVTDFWYEEATEDMEVRNVRELIRRLRDPKMKCSLTISFNPVYRTHWIKEWMETELAGLDVMILRTTYKDNLFRDPEYDQTLERLKYSDPWAYQVYALGEWGTTGISVFNSGKVNNRLNTLLKKHTEEPPSKIEFTFERAENGLPDKDTFKPFKYADGETTIYEWVNPKRPYVLAFDTAGEGSDYYAGHVIDNVTGRQVAVYRSQRDPDVCVLQIYGLGRMYNNALICPEINFDSYPLKKLQELHYPNIYQRNKPVDSYSYGYEQKLGFRTTSENRQRILSELVEWANEHIDLINDVDTLNEMLTFTRQARKQKGIFWAAEAGAHDDLIMALAIALQAREQQLCEEQAEKVELKGFWYPEQLEMAVKDGQIERHEASAYRKKHSIFGEFEQAMKGKGRYGR